MVQTIAVTGIAQARTTPISLGAYLGARERLGIITAVRLIKNSFLTPSMHALAAHSHALSGHALANHSHAASGHVLADNSHNMYNAITVSPAFDQDAVLSVAAGVLQSSDPGGGVPPTSGVTGGTPAGGIDGVGAGVPAAGIDGVTGGTMTGGGLEGKSITVYVVDSSGSYVLAATAPATRHIVNRFPGDAGPRVELGDAILATDILEITTLLQNESGGVF